MFSEFGGFKVISCEWMVNRFQVRFPRSKRKRIRVCAVSAIIG